MCSILFICCSETLYLTLSKFWPQLNLDENPSYQPKCRDHVGIWILAKSNFQGKFKLTWKERFKCWKQNNKPWYFRLHKLLPFHSQKTGLSQLRWSMPFASWFLTNRFLLYLGNGSAAHSELMMSRSPSRLMLPLTRSLVWLEVF